MWPLLIVNYVKLIELKRLLVYSKESCNNLANIIHGHRRFRLKRPLNDLHSAATGGSRPGRAEERREGRCQSDGHLTRGWHNVTIPGSDPGVWVRHVTWTIALSQDGQTAESQGNMRLQTHCILCVFCILDINAGVISGHIMPRVTWAAHTNTRPGHSGTELWLLAFPASQAQPSITLVGPESTLKIFLLRTN